ncbi:HAD family hydrolase [Gynuella sp.]|uniref:HAD family hydrolase n=1 Tax=Gynuella sp. TaxID=2969146 RepID=UPI003D0CD45F
MNKAVLFDCDGVLVDTERLANDINVDLLQEAGISITHQECRTHFLGKTGDQIREWVTQTYGYLPDNLLESNGEWRKRFYQKLHEEDLIIAGIEELLGNLKVDIAVVTNSSLPELTYKLEQTGLNRYFPAHRCFSGVDLNMPKPNPGAYLAAANALAIKPEHCIVIEDSPPGVTAGVAAGMTVLGFSYEQEFEPLFNAGAHHCFSDIPTLSTQLYQYL